VRNLVRGLRGVNAGDVKQVKPLITEAAAALGIPSVYGVAPSQGVLAFLCYPGRDVGYPLAA
jgi:hypothetical protein